jgi:hypothetical protein
MPQRRTKGSSASASLPKAIHRSREFTVGILNDMYGL